MGSIDNVMLLQLVHRGANLTFLRAQGFDYSEVAKALVELKSAGHISQQERKLVVTESGLAMLAAARQKKGMLIFSDENNRIPKLTDKEIFVPERGRINLEP